MQWDLRPLPLEPAAECGGICRRFQQFFGRFEPYRNPEGNRGDEISSVNTCHRFSESPPLLPST